MSRGRSIPARRGCPDCARDLDHCHGVAIEHADGVPDCTEGAPCTLPPSLHAAAVPCPEVSCDCGLVLMADTDLDRRRDRHVG
jgi:hypothetical protein